MSLSRKIALIILALLLFGVTAAFAVFRFFLIPLEGQYVWTNTESYTSRTVTSADVDALLRLKAPKLLDLRGAALSEADIARLAAAFPSCEIRWSVYVNGQTLDGDTTAVTLTAPTEADIEALHRLKKLTDVTVTDCEDYDLLRAAEAANPMWTWHWSVASIDVDDEPVKIEHTVTDWTVTDPLPLDALTEVLDAMPELLTVTLRDTALSNADVAALVKAFPDVAFAYTVRVGDVELSPDTSALTLGDSSGITDIAALAQALPYLPKLETVDLEPLGLTNDELKKALPQLDGLALQYTVELYGARVEPTITAVDLSGIKNPTVDSLADALPLLPSLHRVILGKWQGDWDSLSAFMTAIPELTYDYSFTITYLDREIDSETEELDLSATTIPDLNELRAVLAQLPKLKNVNMLDCGVDDPSMCALADDFPEIKFLWELNLGIWGRLRTDATAYSARSTKTERQIRHRFNDETVKVFRYCTELVALDLGHQNISDISFLLPLKKLKVIILADNRVKDISVLGELPELEYVELFMNRIEDVSPLKKLTKLRDLNLCSNKVKDFTPLTEIPTLQRLWYARNNYTKADHAMLKEALPNTLLNYTVKDGTGDGWRTHDNYYWMRAFFKDAPRYE